MGRERRERDSSCRGVHAAFAKKNARALAPRLKSAKVDIASSVAAGQIVIGVLPFVAHAFVRHRDLVLANVPQPVDHVAPAVEARAARRVPCHKVDHAAR